jgi:AbrB family looped-hinge helix DNA binding protein
MKNQEPSITTIGTKGQVVIPQKLRKHLGVEPQTKFLVFGQGDVIVLKRLSIPDVSEEWAKVFAMAKRAELSEAKVAKEVKASRQARR